MKDFLFIYRINPAVLAGYSPEEMQDLTKRWMDWMGSIAAQNKLSDKGNRLVPDGKVLKQNGVITDGPYTETKEIISGYTVVKAATMEEATELAGGCPIYSQGGCLEVREVRVL